MIPFFWLVATSLGLRAHLLVKKGCSGSSFKLRRGDDLWIEC